MDSLRRDLLRGVAASALASASGILASRVSFAAPAAGDARFVFVLLRGALDGLAAVPPIGDANYRQLRNELALNDVPGLVRLDDLFSLHPHWASWQSSGGQDGCRCCMQWPRRIGRDRISMRRMFWRAASHRRMPHSRAG